MYPTIVLRNKFERILCVLRHIECLMRDAKHVSNEIKSMYYLVIERDTRKNRITGELRSPEQGYLTQ